MKKEKENLNKIHILGSSGSGTTTLGAYLSSLFSCPLLDADDYLWETKYTQLFPRDERLRRMRRDLANSEKWIISGAIIDWGDPLIPLFDLVIFLSVPRELRLKRLEEREFGRYGEAILPGGDKHTQYLEFIAWAGSYESGGMDIRSRTQQEAWLQQCACPVLRLSGINSPRENGTIIQTFMGNSQNSP